MTFMQDLLDLMPATVYVAKFLSQDGYGQKVYAKPVGYRSRVNNQQRYVRTAEGELVVARGVAWLNTLVLIDPQDQITLPDGTNPLILVSDQEQDETGPIFTKLWFA